ncbi:Ser/Thr protein phosphatase superfamily [Pochonia chlamydosporia 170]|uniref:Ser/Thr protein phosphatase superfamily n=1 Tax=Pochonia chlamydosporia 170 TaxID=1380566 RepID=A0A179F9H3_METCM|nr:Ser/Thr protein phosphatase superfamily [Pochonia chlamydosporia 170]OAQ62047.1 Ser/Thr protein phosphatase superfamily [Pochonia chlamydosporia 170]
MSIQVISDLHLESPKCYHVYEIVPKAPYLALLGDIGNIGPHTAEYLAFLRLQLKSFKAVLLVPGNHEAYHSNWDDTLSTLRTFEDECRQDTYIGEFALLDRTTLRLPHITMGIHVNDFSQITDWTTDNHNDMHAKDLNWLNDQVTELEKTDVSIMILTHWSPSRDPRAIDPKHMRSLITSGFCTDLSKEPCFVSGKVKVWAFGHTHYNCDFEVGRRGGVGLLRLVTNQAGYAADLAEGFDPGKTVVL